MMNEGFVIDARDYGCDLPVTMAQAALSKVKSGMVEVLVAGEDGVENLRRFAIGNSMRSEAEKTEDYWKVIITKGPGADIPREKSDVQKEETFLVISTDILGKDDEIGKILMKAFFETMLATGNVPQTIFFLNAGVRLTTVDDSTIPILKKLEESGVKIFSCGTCLKYYGLDSNLRVGAVGSMQQTVSALNQYRVVWT